MVTADSVKAKIQNLIVLANTATGRRDTDLTNAVNALVSGFGAGGGIMELGNKLYSFGAISDIHVPYGNGAEDLRRTISVLQNEGAEFICIAGDIGHGGTVSELQAYKEIVDEVATIPLYSCTGNHDKPHTNENWNTYVGHDLNYVFEYQNDVFILFSFATAGNMTATEDTPYGETNLAWLKAQLDIYKGRRIFLFMHYPLSGYSGLRTGTYYGFSNLSTEDEHILSMMNIARNVVNFSGHTHFYVETEEIYDNMNVMQMNFNNCATVHIPSSNYPRNAANAAEDTGSEGYLVTVYENAVVLKAMDFINGVYLDGYEYYLPITQSTVETGNALMVSDISMVISEGATRSFTARLFQRPTENVTISVAVDNSHLTLDKSQLVFTPDNYAEPQVVYVTAAENDDYSGYSSVVTLSGDGMSSRTVSFTISDNDTVIPSAYTWEEGFISGGDYAIGNGFITTPFDVRGHETLSIHCDKTGMGGTSSCYIYFYSSADISSATLVSSVQVMGDMTLAVPSNAICAIMRSTNSPTATLADIGTYLYIDGIEAIAPDLPTVLTPVELTWEAGGIGGGGAEETGNFFRSLPFSVEGAYTMNVHVSSSLGGSSSPYCYFYNSSECNADTFISRVAATEGITKSIKIPEGALYCRIRSTSGSGATLETIGSLIYLVGE